MSEQKQKCPDCNGHGGLLYEPGCIVSECAKCKGTGLQGDPPKQMCPHGVTANYCTICLRVRVEAAERERDAARFAAIAMEEAAKVLREEVERLQDQLTLEKDRADFINGTIEGMEKGFLPEIGILKIEKRWLEDELAAARKMIEGLSARIAEQSELLSRRAEKEPTWSKALPVADGYWWHRHDISEHAVILCIRGGRTTSQGDDPGAIGGEWCPVAPEPGGDAVENCREFLRPDVPPEPPL